ncbi:MAG: DUF2163 domain-containing protein [Pseudooceanicola sp.]|nr:DUF2163 domain-containing protein [Pseudooceanicola sp.]
MEAGFQAHLAGGVTTVCRCWAVTRRDGVEYGFTDHDRALSFEGITFKADTGLTAKALQQGTGLAVDNTEAMGVLSDVSIREADIDSGRLDGAEVRAWLVNWADVGQRHLQFRGALGEIRRAGGAFHAELRGLTEMLNRPLGRVYQKPCTAVLGDASCRFDLSAPGYSVTVVCEGVEAARIFRWPALDGFEPGWFTRGRLQVLTGAASGLSGVVKGDRAVPGFREVELWEPVRAAVVPGDMIRLEAGCDKRMETCRLKFLNFINFQGFPDIPGEDWVMAVPRRTGANTGGSLR